MFNYSPVKAKQASVQNENFLNLLFEKSNSSYFTKLTKTDKPQKSGSEAEDSMQAFEEEEPAVINNKIEPAKKENNNNKDIEIIIKNDDTDNNEDEDDCKIKQCSAASPWAIIPGFVVDAFDGDTKDGKIGNTQQHSTGDCWLLSGINALSYTEEGAKLIKDALEYHNGYTIVHLAVGDYVVYDYEITTTKGSSQYSSGDDDMIILELAIEKALDDIANGVIELKEDAPWYLTNDTDDDGNRTSTTTGKSSTRGGWQSELWYLLTGKTSDTHSGSDMKKSLDEFQQNGNKDKALSCSLNKTSEDKNVEGFNKDDSTITDVNGKKHKLGFGHAYAIKEVTDTTVTVINPWDSSDEIVLSREQFMALFDYTQEIDLSDNNSQKDYTTFNVKDENGNIKNYENRRIKYDDKGNVEWIAYDGVDENGKAITAFDTDNDGVIDQYYQDGKYKVV